MDTGIKDRYDEARRKIDEFYAKEIERAKAVAEFKAKFNVNSQIAKDDAGKIDLTLVPRAIIWEIGRVREYGTKKYGSPGNWVRVSPDRYRAAAMRHFLRYLDDPQGVDEESGLPHLSHLACNIAFLCEMEKGGDEY